MQNIRTLEFLTKWESKILIFIEKYENIVSKVTGFFASLAVKLLTLVESFASSSLDLINLVSKPIRYSTYPLHWIWIKLEIYLSRRESKLTDLPQFKLGAHYIYGKPGSGKSTFMYHSMMDYAYHTGKTSYTTAMMETPRKDKLRGHEYYYHQIFSPGEFFEDGKQVVAFDTQKHNVVVYEEILGIYHQRNNAKKSYNDEVIPMIGAMGDQRHQGIDLFFFISQLPKNDIAIMQMLRGYHEPKIKKEFDYKNWLKTGKYNFRIKGWLVTSHQIIASGSDFKLINKKTWFYKNKYDEDFEYFNTLNMKSKYEKMKVHKGVAMQ